MMFEHTPNLAAAAFALMPFWGIRENSNICGLPQADELQRNSRAGNEVKSDRSVRSQINAIRALSAGWQGFNSAAISPELIKKAENTIAFASSYAPLEQVPAVVPCADGSVQVEWHLHDSRFEMYFETDGSVNAWWHQRITGLEIEAEDDMAMKLLARWATRPEAWLPVKLSA